MADGANVSTGMGNGWAQVFDTSGLVNAYMQEERARQKELLAQQKSFDDMMGKVSMDGIKDADIPYLQEGYNKVLDTYSQLKKVSNSADRLTLQNKLREDINGLTLDINKSKNANKYWGELRKYGAQNYPDELAPDYYDRADQVRNLPTFSPEFANLKTDDLQVKQKVVDVNKELESIAKQSLEYSETGLRDIGNNVQEYMESKSLKPSKLQTNLSNRLMNDPRFKRYALSVYTDGYDHSNRDANEQEAKQLGFEKFDKNSIADYIALQTYKGFKGSEAYDKVEKKYRNRPKDFNINVNVNNGDERVAAGNAVENQPLSFTNAVENVNGKNVENVTSSTVARKWLPVNNGVDVNTYGGINMETGERYTDQKVISGKVIGIGELPILRKTGGFVKDRHINAMKSGANMDWKDYFIVSVEDSDGEKTRVAVPLSQYPLADAWTKAYKEIGVRGQIQGANKKATSSNTNRLNRVQTGLTSSNTKPSETKYDMKMSDVIKEFNNRDKTGRKLWPTLESYVKAVKEDGNVIFDDTKGKAGSKPSGGTTTSKGTDSGKSVPMSTIKSLVGKKGYEGYTEKELIEYYKSQGYTVK